MRDGFFPEVPEVEGYKEARYCGYPLTDFTYDELMRIICFMGSLIAKEQNDNFRNIEFYNDLLKKR